jgi:hypothetical protein
VVEWPAGTRIVAHHVGARGLGRSVNVPAPFVPEIVHAPYEADVVCAPETPTPFEARLNRRGFTGQEYLVRGRRVVALRDASRLVGSATS